MSVYTVYEPPLRAAEAAPNPERFVFVRDGFSFWAFLLAPLWMLWHRLWLVLLIYIVVAVGLDSAAYYAGIDAAGVSLIELCIAVLIGFEASTLRRFTLARRGFENVGVVAGDTIEAAEQRFFDAWVGSAREKSTARAVAPGRVAPPALPPLTPSPVPPSPGIIGLFPEPGGQR